MTSYTILLLPVQSVGLRNWESGKILIVLTPQLDEISPPVSRMIRGNTEITAIFAPRKGMICRPTDRRLSVTRGDFHDLVQRQYCHSNI